MYKHLYYLYVLVSRYYDIVFNDLTLIYSCYNYLTQYNKRNQIGCRVKICRFEICTNNFVFERKPGDAMLVFLYICQLVSSNTFI